MSEQKGVCPKCGMKLVQNHTMHSSMEQDFRNRFFLTLPFVLLTMLLSHNIQTWLHFSFIFPGQSLVLFLIGTFIFLVGGIPFFTSAKGEVKAKNPGMMTLVAFAISVGYIFSVAATFFFPGESLYWEISTLISVFLLGHYLEMRSVRGATSALTELTKLIPPTAHKISGKTTEDVPTESLQLHDVVVVKPGEKIPVDGVVIDGESSVNEALITGESKPVAKKKDSVVIGGSINNDGSLTIQITKIGKDTAISQIIQLIQEAQQSKPNVQLLADKAAGVLFYVALFAGVAAFLFWLYVIPQGVVFAATVAVSAIVVACPHALGLAIPTVTTITSTLGAKNGILIKDMKALEVARKISYVVFDKTGTLTKGTFAVTNIQSVKTTEKNLLAMASAVESKSQHAIAQGIIEKAQEENIKIPPVTKFISYPGKGAEGIVGGKNVLVGNKKLFDEKKIALPDISPNGTQVFVAIDSVCVGVIALSDVVRNESKKTVADLQAMGIKVAMLTGDTQDVAEKIGKELEIDTVYAHVLPDEKVAKIRQLQNLGNVVAMVGDGVNDAPSLTQANVGIAIGAGTDVAVASSGIVLMKSNPLDVVKAISLSRATNRKMVENLLWATGYNVLAIPLAAGVLYTSFGLLLRPEWSALLMSASSIIVVANALLLRKTKLV